MGIKRLQTSRYLIFMCYIKITAKFFHTSAGIPWDRLYSILREDSYGIGWIELDKA